MFEKFDNFLIDFLVENSSEDYWYDCAVTEAQELLCKFTAQDWKKLFQVGNTKSDLWKIRVVYCIEEENGMDGFDFLLSMLNENNDEVVEYAIDSLRSFNTENYKNLIKSNTDLKTKAESLLENAGLPVKRVLEEFLKIY